MVPGEAQNSSGGRCEGSNPPQGVPGDHSWLTLGGSMTWWADSTMEHACAIIIIIIYSLNFPYLRVLALSICPNRTVSSVLNIYQFMCPMPTVLNMSEKS